MTTEQVAFGAVSVSVAALGVFLTIRNWVYGGSVVRVELELARREDWGGLITGTIARWKRGDSHDLLKDLRGTQVDLAKVTVRNLGRTAATIHDVGLRVGPPPTASGSWTAMANRLLPIGETDEVVRLEAHDAKVFYFHIVPILRSARKALGEGPLAIRAHVMTGVGRPHLSRRWHHLNWNIWVVRGLGDRSILDEPLTTPEWARLWVELTDQIFEPRPIWVKQITGEAARLADDGKSREEMVASLTKMLAIFGKSEHPSRDLRFVDALIDGLTERRGNAGDELLT